MILSKLLENINAEIWGDAGVNVTSLCMNDAEACDGSLFFCLEGTRTDGHSYAESAVRKGTVAVVAQRKLDLDVTQIIVADSRKAMSLIASAFYGKPSRKLHMVGVTGTNGKTTTCHLIRNILETAGYRTGLIGTLGISYGMVERAPSLTTPDPIMLHKTLKDMADAGVEYVVMEASAHAIALEKLGGIRFEVGVFTNCTRDHLDFFGDMNEYGKVKARFMTDEFCDFTVFNSDDELGRKLLLSAGIESASYGIESPSDVFAVEIKENAYGTSFFMNLFDNIFEVKCAMAGRFSVYNCLAAATCCAVLGVDFDDITEGIRKTKGVKGRVEKVENKAGKNIFVDFAHTPDGLKNVLQSLRRCVAGKLICLFGCGGNRDKGKREIMGEVAGEYSDFSIITSDNPRFEEPLGIIADIESGIRKKTDNYITIQDRECAIKYAIDKMGKDDLLLVAGKGAEEYQEVLGVKHDFSDRKCIEKYLSEVSD